MISRLCTGARRLAEVMNGTSTSLLVNLLPAIDLHFAWSFRITKGTWTRQVTKFMVGHFSVQWRIQEAYPSRKKIGGKVVCPIQFDSPLLRREKFQKSGH